MEKELKQIPFVVHEAAMFRKERIIDKLVKALVISEAIFSAACVILFLRGDRK
ncbi:MAG: hypothetical protein IIW81_05250 [Oscillospiraceae bacterium]|nr:hypothetical protein [Oscillospiraceae bacterium]